MLTDAVRADRRSAPQANGTYSGPVASALTRWQADLLDLSRANRLLYFTPGRGVLSLTHPGPSLLFDGLVNYGRTYTVYQPEEDVEETDGAAGKPQLDLILTSDAPDAVDAEVVLGESRLRPPRADEIVASGEAQKIAAALYRLRLRARSALLEQGINVLFATFGTLEWRESSTSGVRIQSPLILVPVRLDRPTARDSYTVTALDEGALINPALARKLTTDFNLPLTLPDDSERDLTLESALEHIRGTIAGQRDWNVHADAHLGLFSFAKYAMYADLEANQGRFSEHPIIRLLSGEEDGLPDLVPDAPSADYLDEHLKPADVFQVLDADASQQEAIAAVKAGISLKQSHGGTCRRGAVG